MFYHHVVDYLEKSLFKSQDKDLDEYKIKLLDRFRGAQRFYLGNVESVRKVCGITKSSKYTGRYEDMKPPFPITYLDFTAPTMRSHVPGIYQWNKGALLMVEEDDQYFVACFFYVPEIKSWWHDNMMIVADLPTNNDGIFDHNGRQLRLDKEERVFKENATHTMALFCLHRLLRCKNIKPVDVLPPAKVNKKRKKKRKSPMLSYKVLMVDSVGSSRVKYGLGLSDGLMALSMTMGHFKNYTKEKPLFGKYHGEFWWQPTIKGNAKNGVIKKRYNVTKLVQRRIDEDN